MLPSFLLSLREGLEAALIIGIVLGALKKIQRTQFNKNVWFGAGSAVLLSLFAALGLNALGASNLDDFLDATPISKHQIRVGE